MAPDNSSSTTADGVEGTAGEEGAEGDAAPELTADAASAAVAALSAANVGSEVWAEDAELARPLEEGNEGGGGQIGMGFLGDPAGEGGSCSLFEEINGASFLASIALALACMEEC